MDRLADSSTVQLAVAVITLALARWAWLHARTSSIKRALPPGPKPLPLIGNLYDLPVADGWRVFNRWAQAYGDVVYIEALGKRIVVLNSAEAAVDLLERRSAIYSDRDTTIMVHELMNWGWILGNVSYGEQWRLERRILHELVHTNIVSRYDGVLLRSARNFLKVLSHGVDDVGKLVRYQFGALVMDVTYGVEVSPSNDRYIQVAEEAMGLLSQAEMPGAFLVDVIHPLKYVPGWFPGAGFKKMAALSRQLTQELLDRPFGAVKKAMAEGNARPGMATTLLQSVSDEELTAETEAVMKRTLAQVYAAGSDTTVSTVTCLFLAMARHPEILAKAQAELDAVVGQEQLPDFSHQAYLPYVQAIMLELLRWQPVTPIGVPHKSEDDVYKEYFIPKGTIVIGNIWQILHNPDDYPEPDEFKLAERSLFAITANILAAFDITAPRDADGNPVYPEVKMGSGVLLHPVPFKCVVTPRSKAVEELVNLPLPDRGL